MLQFLYCYFKIHEISGKIKIFVWTNVGENEGKKKSKYIRYFSFIDVKIFLRRLYVSCRCIYRSKAVFSSGKPEKNANTDDGQCWTGDRISARLRPSCERRWRFFLLFFFSFLFFSFPPTCPMFFERF